MLFALWFEILLNRLPRSSYYFEESALLMVPRECCAKAKASSIRQLQAMAQTLLRYAKLV